MTSAACRQPLRSILDGSPTVAVQRVQSNVPLAVTVMMTNHQCFHEGQRLLTEVVHVLSAVADFSWLKRRFASTTPYACGDVKMNGRYDTRGTSTSM